MNRLLELLMQQLNQISVQGDDVERLAAARHLVRQLQAALVKAQSKKEDAPCPTSQPRTDTKSI